MRRLEVVEPISEDLAAALHLHALDIGPDVLEVEHVALAIRRALAGVKIPWLNESAEVLWRRCQPLAPIVHAIELVRGVCGERRGQCSLGPAPFRAAGQGGTVCEMWTRTRARS